MKKYIIVGILGISIVSFGALVSNELDGAKPDGEKSQYQIVNEIMHENVYPELYDLVDYDPEKRFSRCPSGMAQVIDEELSTNEMIWGEIFNREGCSSEHFALYQLNLTTKVVKLKAEEKESFSSIDAFVNGYEDDRASNEDL
jgi:hypothetical protein